MKAIPLMAAVVMLAACAQSPTGPSAQSSTSPNLSSLREARNPSTAGQPGASCEISTTEPKGFTNSAGFENAESNYAGSEDTHSLNSNNPLAVSQYDVACYQLTSK
jgi:hypothetical protein